MLKNIQKRNSEGFTIIEVLIVLAIAGLIMVVVFLAVPALQRSGRNNALNTDANNILTGVGNYSSNNGGTLPTGIGSFASGNTTLTIGTSGNTETVKVDSGIKSVVLNDGSSAIGTSAGAGAMEIVTGPNGVCNSTGTALNTPLGGGSPRSYAVLYVAESGSGPILKCIGA